MPPSEMLYGNTGDYYWPQFNQNVTAATVMGGWKAGSGVVQGPFGFGKAISVGPQQVELYSKAVHCTVYNIHTVIEEG